MRSSVSRMAAAAVVFFAILSRKRALSCKRMDREVPHAPLSWVAVGSAMLMMGLRMRRPR